MNKVFVHMDEGWPEWCRTKLGGTDGKSRIYHIRADHNPGNGAPWSLGCCALELGTVCFEVRPNNDIRTIMYMFTRLRQQGRDIESHPICMWCERDSETSARWLIRIGVRTLVFPSAYGVSLPEDRQLFQERIEELLDTTFPPEAYSPPYDNWRTLYEQD